MKEEMIIVFIGIIISILVIFLLIHTYIMI